MSWDSLFYRNLGCYVKPFSYSLDEKENFWKDFLICWFFFSCMIINICVWWKVIQKSLIFEMRECERKEIQSDKKWKFLVCKKIKLLFPRREEQKRRKKIWNGINRKICRFPPSLTVIFFWKKVLLIMFSILSISCFSKLAVFSHTKLFPASLFH